MTWWAALLLALVSFGLGYVTYWARGQAELAMLRGKMVKTLEAADDEWELRERARVVASRQDEGRSTIELLEEEEEASHADPAEPGPGR